MPQPDTKDDPRLAVFLAERKRLMRLAYRYLGSVSDAEDVVQDCWLRFSRQDDIEAPERYLSRIVTRLCLDRLKSAQARRETYVGPWLPEPVADENGEAGDAALDISFGVMRALERLSPLERAAFFLHDLYEVPYEEVAETLHRSPAACRKLAERGRKAIAAAGQRFRPQPDDVSRFVDVILESSRTGDIGPLQKVLAADVEIVTDGGGKKTAALNVVSGRDHVSRFIAGLTRKNLGEDFAVALVTINGAPSLLIWIGGTLDQTVSIDLNAAGEIAGVYIVRNPDKLAHLAARYPAPAADARG